MRNDHVDLWHVRTDSVQDATLEVCRKLMSASEATRHERFVFDRHRHEYLVTRGLARGLLSTYVSRPARDLVFVASEYGRPILEDCGNLHFNLTNTPQLVACIVGSGREVGVDAEPLARADEILAIQESVFTRAEREGLERLSLPARRRRAVELWTLKEAYMKARGLGMSLSLDKFEFVFGDGIGLRFFPPVHDAPSRWTVTTLEIESHLVSACVETENYRGVDVRVRRADLAALVSA